MRTYKKLLREETKLQTSSAKIRAFHLQRRACVYIRQSTVFQVTHHRESTERQYNLRQRALAFGWKAEAVDIIDEDQGQSATSAEHRQGFQRLAAEVAAREVGIVFMLEASRLARCCCVTSPLTRFVASSLTKKLPINVPFRAHPYRKSERNVPRWK